MALLRQLSYAIKNQLKAPESPHSLPFAVSLVHKSGFHAWTALIINSFCASPPRLLHSESNHPLPPSPNMVNAGCWTGLAYKSHSLSDCQLLQVLQLFQVS